MKPILAILYAAVLGLFVGGWHMRITEPPLNLVGDSHVPAAAPQATDSTTVGRRPPGLSGVERIATEGTDGTAAVGGGRMLAQPRIAALLNAIRRVESGGSTNPRPGDGGRARGPFQIHLVWWLDSGGTRVTYYRDVWNPAACQVRAYALWEKRCPAALASGDLETLARTFRRPVNPWHPDNEAYWRKVQKEFPK